jgi:hypothetical protein
MEINCKIKEGEVKIKELRVEIVSEIGEKYLEHHYIHVWW